MDTDVALAPAISARVLENDCMNSDEPFLRLLGRRHRVPAMRRNQDCAATATIVSYWANCSFVVPTTD